MSHLPFPSRAFRLQRHRSPAYYFAFGIDDLSTDAPTGQTLAFDRNSGRTVLDSTGQVATLAYDQVPWSAAYNSTALVWEPVYEPMKATTNLCLRSEDFGTTWSAVGSPTRTAAGKTCGDLALDLIGDDASGALEGYTQVVTFTGNAVKAVSLFMAAGTSTSTVIRLRDTSASANRLLVAITWSGGVPTVTPTTGSTVATVACAGGVYRFLFQTTSVTAANTNQIEVYPATTSGLATSDTGTVYAGGVQAENYDYPRAYIKTLGSTVTTVADRLTTTFTQPIADFTLYARLARPVWADLSGTFTGECGIADIAGGAGAYWAVSYNTSTREFRIVTQDSGAVGSTSTYATVPAGSIIELCAQFVNVTSGLKVRIDTGSGFGSYGTTLGAVTSWNSTAMVIGGTYSATTELDAGLRRLIIAPGAQTLAALRGVQP